MAAKVASKKGIDTTKAAKLVRSKLRANFDVVAKNDATVRNAKSAANDGNRWPTNMNASTFAFVVENKAYGKKARSKKTGSVNSTHPGNAPTPEPSVTVAD